MIPLRDTVGMRLGVLGAAVAILALFAMSAIDLYMRATYRDEATAQLAAMSIRGFRLAIDQLGPGGDIVLSEPQSGPGPRFTREAPANARRWPGPWLVRNIRLALDEPDADIEALRVPLSPRPLRIGFDANGERYWLELPLRPRSGVRPGVFVLAVIVGLFAISAAAGYTLVVRPLQRLRDRVKAVGPNGDASMPPSPRGEPSEIVDVSDAFNQVLGRLAAQRQERDVSLAAISHDLRSPLTRLRMRLETEAEPKLRDAGVADVMAIDRVLGQFLAYARGAPPQGPSAPLRDILAGHLDGYRQQGVEIEPLGQAGPLLPVEPVARIVSNLLDNALRHGRPPVRLGVRLGAGAVEIVVSDGGPGIPAEALEQARQPFVQLDRARSAGGAGLGLAIVDRLAGQLGGTMRYVRHNDRFEASLVLPVRERSPG